MRPGSRPDRRLWVCASGDRRHRMRAPNRYSLSVRHHWPRRTARRALRDASHRRRPTARVMLYLGGFRYRRQPEIPWIGVQSFGTNVGVGKPLEPTRPFRWDVTRRECLGSLVARPRENLWYLKELEACAAKVLARCSNARQLYFVGRSPARICDYLTGALECTSWGRRLVRLPFSMRWEDDRRRVLGDAAFAAAADEPGRPGPASPRPPARQGRDRLR